MLFELCSILKFSLTSFAFGSVCGNVSTVFPSGFKYAFAYSTSEQVFFPIVFGTVCWVCSHLIFWSVLNDINYFSVTESVYSMFIIGYETMGVYQRFFMVIYVYPQHYRECRPALFLAPIDRSMFTILNLFKLWMLAFGRRKKFLMLLFLRMLSLRRIVVMVAVFPKQADCAKYGLRFFVGSFNSIILWSTITPCMSLNR